MSESDLQGTNGLSVLLNWLQPAATAPSPLAAARDAEADLVDTIAQERAAAFEAGVTAGRVAAEAELAPIVAALRGAEGALQAACVIDVGAVQSVLTGLVRAVVERVLLAELRVGDSVLDALVLAALAEVQPDEAPVLRVHPDALALIEQISGREVLAGLTIVIDAGMPRDGFAVEGPEFVISAGLMARLDCVMAELS